MPDSTSYADYFTSVESHGESVIERIKAGEDDVMDLIHEEVDGSWWVIYTHAALAVLQHSRNDDAGFDSMGSDFLAGCTSMAEVYTRAAYFALEADVIEWLNERGDVNDPDSFREEEEEEEEEEDETPADDAPGGAE
jgi:hypothetical protein